MFDPLSLGVAAVSGGLDIAGGFIDDARNRRMADEATDAQRQFAQHGIQWRVEDAKRAGIHPLYALGAQTHSFSPMTIGSNVGAAMSRAGQDVGRSIERGFDREGRRSVMKSNQLMDAQIHRTEAERMLIEQQTIDIMNRRGENQGGGFLTDHGPTGSHLAVPGQQDSGLFQVVPPKRGTSVPGMPEIQSGPDQAYRKHYFAGGLPMYLPYSDEGPAETMESIPFWQWPGLVALNSNVFGPGWVKEWAGLTGLGRVPKRRQWSENWSATKRR